MKDIFDIIDQWHSNLNIFQPIYFEKAMLFLIAASTIMWVIFGYDSGIGQPMTIISNIPTLLTGKTTLNQVYNLAYKNYGTTGHFSALVIYAFLVIGQLHILKKLGFNGSKTIFITMMLTVANAAFFEQWYIVSYAVFQTPQFFMTWYFSDLMTFGVYALSFFITAYCILYLWAWSFRSDQTRIYRYQWNKKQPIVLCLLLASMLLWWFYPFPFQQYGTQYFPQTVYAGSIYVPNDLVHTVNILVKVMFAFTQFYLLAQFKKDQA